MNSCRREQPSPISSTTPAGRSAICRAWMMTAPEPPERSALLHSSVSRRTCLLSRRFTGAALGLTLLCPTVIQAQEAGKDVAPSHWAYQAVQDLAGKGLI